MIFSLTLLGAALGMWLADWMESRPKKYKIPDYKPLIPEIWARDLMANFHSGRRVQ